ELRGGCAQGERAGARRFLGRMVRSLQDDRAGARGARQGNGRSRDRGQGQYRRESADAAALWRARHPDADPVQGRPGGGDQDRRAAEEPALFLGRIGSLAFAFLRRTLLVSAPILVAATWRAPV